MLFKPQNSSGSLGLQVCLFHGAPWLCIPYTLKRKEGLHSYPLLHLLLLSPVIVINNLCFSGIVRSQRKKLPGEICERGFSYTTEMVLLQFGLNYSTFSKTETLA